MASSEYPVPIMVTLDKDRTICKFGKRIDSITLSNNTAANRKIDIGTYDPTFYTPDGVSFHSDEREDHHISTYFYLNVLAKDSRTIPPFFAFKGLKLKSQLAGGSEVSATVCIAGATPSDVYSGKV